MRICLDTNAYSAFKRGDADIIDLVETADEVAVPSIVLGELFAGFRMGRVCAGTPLNWTTS